MATTEIKICILLASPVTLNGRVQRTARTLSRLAGVIVVTSGGSEGDRELFDDRVDLLFTVRPELTRIRRWFLLHRQNDHLADAALASEHDFDLVWANDYPTLWSAFRIARVTGARVVYDAHEIWLETVNQFFPRNVPLLKRAVFRSIVAICRLIGNRLEPQFAAQADAVVTANQSYADVLSRRFGGTDVTVVLNCPERNSLVASDRIRSALHLSQDDRIVLYQGIMNAGRGLSELVKSAEHLPEGVRLVMIGDGMLLPSLRQAVAKLGLDDRVFLPGPVPQAELHEWTASSDLGVLVLDPINMSKRLALANKIFEYMASAIPILTTDLPENRRIVDECDCGWLIADWKPPALAAHIARILSQPDEMRRRGAHGRRWFEQRYNWEIESGSVLTAVEPLLGLKKGER